MGFLKRLFGGDDGGDATSHAALPDDAEWRQSAEATFDLHADKHRVTIWLPLVDPTFESGREQQRLFALENRLMRALDESGAGEHDTNALERGYLALRLVGDDADAIVATVLPLLSDAPAGSYLAIRRGPSGTGEDRLELSAADGDNGQAGGDA